MSKTSSLGLYEAGLVGNCQSAFLVDKEATVVWGCLPSLASDAVFARILDPEAGHFAIVPLEEATTEQRYLPLTNVLVTRFTTADAEWEVLDWMPRYYQGSQVHYPTELYRLIRVLRGHPRVRVECRPRPRFGQHAVIGHHIGNLLRWEDGGVFFLASNLPLSRIQQEAPLTLGSEAFLSFSYGAPPRARDLKEVELELDKTCRYWTRWSQHCFLPREYQEPILRSALCLKLLTYNDTGAIVAAPTTSLPETPGGVRNWDYRYCWLRDSYFAVRALSRLAQFEEESRYLSYLEQLPLQEGRLQPVYGIAGETELHEEVLEHLQGALGSQPVRRGNQAWEHQQNDVYGELMMTLTPAFFDVRFSQAHRDIVWQVVQRLGDEVCEVWREKDAGIWEYRDLPSHYVFSKMMCWVALDRAEPVARRMGDERRAARYRTEADAIREEVLAQGWSEEHQAFTAAYGEPWLDAANLLMATVEFLPPTDERFVKTVRAIEDKLVRNDLCHRYLADDDFGASESTFTICTFWYVDALRQIGEVDKARRVFERLLGRANHLGLFAEGLNPNTGQMTGNFPQAYSHVALINSGMMLSRGWGELSARDFAATHPSGVEP